MKLHPVNRIVSGIFWILGWGLSYFAVYSYAEREGIVSTANYMYSHCTTATPMRFNGDPDTYICAKLQKL